MTTVFDFNSTFEKVWGIPLMMMENGMGKLAQACKELVEENYTILSRVSKKTP